MNDDEVMRDLGKKVPREVIDALFEALGHSATTVTIAPLQADGDERWVGYWDSASRCWARAEVVDIEAGYGKMMEGLHPGDEDVEILVERGGVVANSDRDDLMRWSATERRWVKILPALDDSYEVLVEENGVTSRRGVSTVGLLGDSLEARRRKYEMRKASNSTFFLPVDHPFGEGHCRSCHHDCRFEHQGSMPTIGCQEPTCGHTAGCPGC